MTRCKQPRIFADVHRAARMVGISPYHFRERFAEPNDLRVLVFPHGMKEKHFFLIPEIRAAKRRAKR